MLLLESSDMDHNDDDNYKPHGPRKKYLSIRYYSLNQFPQLPIDLSFLNLKECGKNIGKQTQF